MNLTEHINQLRPEDFDGVTFQEVVKLFLKMPSGIRGQLKNHIINEAKQADLEQAKSILETRKNVEETLALCRAAVETFDILPLYIRKDIIALVAAYPARVGSEGWSIVRGIEAWLKGERE